METKIHIIVVEDDSDLGEMIKRMLEYKGYIVTLLKDANQIGSVLENKNIDLIIMDMLLSGANGMSYCSELKKNKAFASIPIMMMSAHPNAKEESVTAGADNFIAKPFEMEEMLSKINKLTKRNV